MLSAEVVAFYSYGQNQDGDSNLGSSDEATSGKVPLLRPVCFYGKNYSTVVVSTVVVISGCRPKPVLIYNLLGSQYLH